MKRGKTEGGGMAKRFAKNDRMNLSVAQSERRMKWSQMEGGEGGKASWSQMEGGEGEGLASPIWSEGKLEGLSGHRCRKGKG
jgi:hypothetical protein